MPTQTLIVVVVAPWTQTWSLAAALDLDITKALGGKQVSHISLLLTAFISSILPLSTAHEPCRFSFSPLSPPHI